MKKYLVLSLTTMAFATLLTFFYFRSETKLSARHSEVLSLFAAAKETESAIERDLLKSRNFILQNYDNLAIEESAVDRICVDLRDPLYEIYGSNFGAVRAAIDNYCEALKIKSAQIEQFKSKNAIFRNSVYFVHSLATSPSALPPEAMRILTEALAYSHFHTPAEHASLAGLLRSRKPAKTGSETQLLYLHVQKLLDLKNELDAITTHVVDSDSQKKLTALQKAYARAYDRAADTARIYRQLMLAMSALLVVSLGYIQLRLWKSAQELALANKTLEERVEERTAELRFSNDTVLQQQHQIVSSAKLSALGEMAGQIAHEINTPLGAIVLTTQGLRRKALEENAVFNPTEIAAKMDFMLRITTKLARIINSMRQLAGHGANEEFTETSVKTLVEDTLLLCNGRLTKAGIDFQFENQLTEELRVQCRANEISQVLVNLLNNAHDAVKSLPDKWVRLTISRDDRFVFFRLTDSGGGIAPEHLTKLFSPQFTTKSLDNGTGFGLSISRKIIEKHGGRIFIDSQMMYTSFVFQIPLEQTEALAHAANG